MITLTLLAIGAFEAGLSLTDLRDRRRPSPLIWIIGSTTAFATLLLGWIIFENAFSTILPLIALVLWAIWGAIFTTPKSIVARAATFALGAALMTSRMPTLLPAISAAHLNETTSALNLTPLTVVGVVLMMARPSNEFIAATLTLVRQKESMEEPPGERNPHTDQSLLRGGRWIGSLERILILSLAFIDAPAAIAAVIAAKGVIRFPEISRNDQTRGRAAEEFLIGSFSSWLLAVGAYLVLSNLPAVGIP
ncbi:hypothetical protein [Schaalia vaccimaxillae]|uniref:hypothetical protein n=1 Tax=Schaalia vaccimaxillae TaxID=183916 RepID=UPI000407E458|nr:hypothetical protein [Schaalia vaccimaxillae]